jgi:NAD(P)-dependent dehydrogenase (short-subunit alcohol dehydrogenase family)
MDQLSSCYFCGGALDVSLSEYPIIPKSLDPEAQKQGTVVLCSTCREKLATIIEPAVEAAITATVERFGGLDILVNNAGISVSGSVHELDRDEWEQSLDVNLTGVYLTTKHAASHLRESDAGRIINLASTAAFEGGPRAAGYCATKAGVVNLTRQMAVDYGPDGVTVNALCPGPIYTSMSQGTFDDPERREIYEEHVLVPYFGEPSDVGKLTRFLASDAARYITGTAIPIDGGWLASR